MKILPMKIINMKGNKIDLEIKKHEVSTKDRWLVKNFIRTLNSMTEYLSNEEFDNLNNEIQHIISTMEINPVPQQVINKGLKTLEGYFDMKQVKYLKMLGISAISEDYKYGYKHRLIQRYFDNYKDDSEVDNLF